MIILKNFLDLEKKHLDLNTYQTIVILAKYNFGKSSQCTNKIFNFFGKEKTSYVTFIDQSKPNFNPRKSELEFGQLVDGKIIIFDEISDEKARDVGTYLRTLVKKNNVIILSNPYGHSNNPEKEIALFKKIERLGNNCLFIYVQEKWN